MMTYKKTTKSGRVKLEYRWPNGHNNCDIYAKQEQLQPYFSKYGEFCVRLFLAHLDSYRTCGFVAYVPLNNVRVVTKTQPNPKDEACVKIVNHLNLLRYEEKEKRRNRPKASGWQIWPAPSGA